MIGALNTQGHKCVASVMKGAANTLVSEEIFDIFHNYDIDHNKFPRILFKSIFKM